MPREIYYAGTEFERLYPHCKAVRAGGTLYIAGTGGVDHATGAWPDSVGDQTRLALDNIELVLGKFGMTLADVVRCELFYVDPEAWTQAMPVVAGRFQGVAAAHIALQAPMPVAQMKVEFQITAWSDRPTPSSPEILVAGHVG